ncbi:hypothetical protein MKW94_007176 [Papaver nudicaule]|uniref:Uncharacterized protein n=1 Tax=Papaver nudicaule TaxID=74823 RepID=A0AA41VNG3_PAPNU|nr:hypothetical protein [Papaver nudicaule]
MEDRVRRSPRIAEQARLQNEGHVRRSRRIIQQARVHLEIENEQARLQRDVELQNRRISANYKRAAMTESEKEEQRAKQRKAYHMRKMQNVNDNEEVVQGNESTTNSVADNELHLEQRPVAYNKGIIRIQCGVGNDQEAGTSSVQGCLKKL